MLGAVVLTRSAQCAAIVQLVSACGEPRVATPCDGGNQPNCESKQLSPEIGFLELDEKSYALGGTSYLASPARFFYDFQPAEQAHDQSPVFVLSGGGPAASALFLLAFLAPNAIGGSGGDISAPSPNDASLTKLGHVLTIEARNAGFSYPLLEEPSSRALRNTRFGIADYNAYRDASDLWQVLLVFLEQHPSLAQRPLVFLTESYGALRAEIQLDMLLNVDQYSMGERRYSEPEFFEMLAQFAASAEVRGQVLLQPWFAGTRQAEVTGAMFEAPGSVVDELAAEAGVVYQRCSAEGAGCNPYENAVTQIQALDRSIYDYRYASEWIDDYLAAVSSVATHRDELAKLCGVEPSTLDGVLDADRSGAYRYADPAHGLFAPPGDLSQRYGTLEPWDSFFVPLNAEARDAFVSAQAVEADVSANQPEWGELLLANARQVPTFVSRAGYDLLIYSPAVPSVIASYPDVQSVELVASTTSSPRDQIQIAFTDGHTGRILSPEYESSHSVSRDATAQLVRDIERFLAEVH